MSPALGEEAIINRSSLSLSLFSSILHLCQLSSKYYLFFFSLFWGLLFINFSVGFSLYPCGRVATLIQLLRIVHAVANEPLYSFDIFPGHFWPSIAGMTLVSDLAAASANVHDSAKLSSGDYDRRLRELVEYLRRLLSTKALDTLANDESILDVSESCFIARMNEYLRATANVCLPFFLFSASTQQKILSHIFLFFGCRFKPRRQLLAKQSQQKSSLLVCYGHEVQTS